MSQTLLTNTIEIVERSIFEAVRRELVDKEYLPDIENYDPVTEVADWKSDIAAVITNKGFCIELFGVGSSDKKYENKIPRIVIESDLVLPGALGGAPDRVYTPIADVDDPLSIANYQVTLMPPQSTDFTFNVICGYETAQQKRIIFQILALALPKRGYISNYTKLSQKIFIKLNNYLEIPYHDKGFKESIFKYEAQDIFEVDGVDFSQTVLNPKTVPSLKSINVKTSTTLDINILSGGATGPDNTIQ